MTLRKTVAIVTIFLTALMTVGSVNAGVPTNQIEDYLKRMNVIYSHRVGPDDAFVVDYVGKNTNAEHVTVFVVNDEDKHVLDCYAYADLKLQNIKQAKDR